MEKKRVAAASGGGGGKKTTVDEGRVDAEAVIDELMAQARIGRMGEDDDSGEGERY